jgi:hypothetical protein
MKISRWGVLAVLIGIMLLLLALHLLFRTVEIDDWDYWELVGLFDMDSEISLFTWYSTTILLFVPSILLFYIGYIKYKAGEKLSWGWFLLGSVFLFLSIDDGAMIHEKLSTLNRVVGLQDVLDNIAPNLFAWSWWIIYLPIIVVLAILLGRWFITLPLRTKILMVSAVIIAILGQVGMEAISGFITNSTGEYVGPVWRGLQKFVGRTGLSLFLFATVDYILSTPNIRSRFATLLGSNATVRK